jgi:acyl carrier protein
MPEQNIDLTAEILRAWLAERVASYVELPPDQVATDVPLNEYGLDPVYAFAVCGDIKDELGVPVDPVMIRDHLTIDALVGALTSQGATPGHGAAEVT